jgi:hypothetical protein
MEFHPSGIKIFLWVEKLFRFSTLTLFVTISPKIGLVVKKHEESALGSVTKLLRLYLIKILWVIGIMRYVLCLCCKRDIVRESFGVIF